MLKMPYFALIIFDLDGTLTNVPWMDKQPRALLPRRINRLAQIRYDYPDVEFAIATNQGGVAAGHQTEEAVRAEVTAIAKAIGTSVFQIAYAFSPPAKGREHYTTPETLKLRKPQPGMLLALMAECSVTPAQTLMVGDSMDDVGAAKNAGVTFTDAATFFGDDVAPPEKRWGIA